MSRDAALASLGNSCGAADDPLVVKPKKAFKMLGCGTTRGYQLLNAGELESYKDGVSRKITVASIHRYIARRLEAERVAAATKLAPSERDGVAGGA